MFLPWKLLFRFFSAMVLLATGGFAAGHDIPLPFTSPPPVTAPSTTTTTAPSTTTTTAPSTTTTTVPPTTTTTAPSATDGSTTTTTAPDGSTTTTTAPDSTPPVVVTPVALPAPTTPVTTTPAPGTPSDTPPVIPVDGDAGAVCAAAATPTCGPAEPVPAPDDSHAARVQRCQDWWNALAAGFTANNEPQWAAQATAIAGQCDAMITKWEQLEQQWAQHQPAPKGDHNGDGHPDNGRGPKGNQPAPPPVQPQASQFSRHGEGRH
jgi:hypothetical protein